MNELTQIELTKDECKRLDDAENSVNASNLELCVAMASIPDKQVAIAKYTGRGKSAVCQMITVGQRVEKFTTSKHLPEGWRSLYELSDLSGGQITDLCSGDKPPTQKAIKERKVELGLLPPPDPEPEIPVLHTGSVLQKLAMLVPARTLDGLSDFGMHALEKESEKIVEFIDRFNKATSKPAMTLFVEILKYQQVVFNAQLRVEAKKAVKERKEAMDAREKKLIERETAIEQGLPIKDKRLIQSVLHPDKAPAGQQARYAKAFDAFRKVV